MSVKCIDRLWQNVQVKCSCGWKRGLGDMGTARRERSRWINRKEERESFSAWQLDRGLPIWFILHTKSLNWQTLAKMTGSNQIAWWICTRLLQWATMRKNLSLDWTAFARSEVFKRYSEFCMRHITAHKLNIHEQNFIIHFLFWVMSLWNTLFF